jgi:hypothetical protein
MLKRKYLIQGFQPIWLRLDRVGDESNKLGIISVGAFAYRRIIRSLPLGLKERG